MKKIISFICIMSMFALLILPEKAYAADPVYTLEGTMGENGWYTSDVTIKCGDSWTVSREENGEYSTEAVWTLEGPYLLTYWFKETPNSTPISKSIDIDIDKSPIGFQFVPESNGETVIVYSGENYTVCGGVDIYVYVPHGDDTLLLNGEAVVLDAQNRFTIAAVDGTQTIYAKDKAGHVTTFTIEMKESHAFGAYVSNNDATYEADGTKTATCIACGATDTVQDIGTKLVRPQEDSGNPENTGDSENPGNTNNNASGTGESENTVPDTGDTTVYTRYVLYLAMGACLLFLSKNKTKDI